MYMMHARKKEAHLKCNEIMFKLLESKLLQLITSSKDNIQI